MADPLYGTEYVAHALTFTRGDSTDVTHVGICCNTNPNFNPEPDTVVGSMAGDFNVVSLIVPPDPLAEGTKIDVLALIGPKAGADFELVAGDYQVWVLVATANEDIVRKKGTLTVL